MGVIYIGYINNDRLASFLEAFFIGCTYFFVIRAFSLILAFINNYLNNYEFVQKYTYLPPYELIFSIVRSLGLSGFFALLEKGLSFSQKASSYGKNGV